MQVMKKYVIKYIILEALSVQSIYHITYARSLESNLVSSSITSAKIYEFNANLWCVSIIIRNSLMMPLFIFTLVTILLYIYILNQLKYLKVNVKTKKRKTQKNS